MYIYIYIHICIYTYICIYIYMYTHIHLHIFSYIYTHTFIHISIHIYMRQCIYICIHIHTDMYHCVPRHVRRPLKSQTTRTLHLLNTWGEVTTKSSYLWCKEPCKEAFMELTSPITTLLKCHSTQTTGTMMSREALRQVADKAGRHLQYMRQQP